MALNASRTWLICYDIRDPRRLGRVYRYLLGEAVPVQYSVFVTRASSAQIGTLRAGLARLIDPKADDVRIYQVPDQPQIATLGTQGLPEGIQLLAGAGRATEMPFTAKHGRHKVQPAGVENWHGNELTEQ